MEVIGAVKRCRFPVWQFHKTTKEEGTQNVSK